MANAAAIESAGLPCPHARCRPPNFFVAMYRYSDYPVETVGDIARLRRRIARSGVPAKHTDYNLLVGSWNIRALGRVQPTFEETNKSPKRNLRALASIAEIIRRFDVVAIQEVKRETTALRTLMNDFLGPNWELILSDVTAGSGGNAERLAYIYDTRRVQPSGLAGEIVLPPTKAGDPTEQFYRTPYIVGIEAGGQRFSLITVHIMYGDVPADRRSELEALAAYAATELRDRAQTNDQELGNLIVLGDFNIDKRGDNPLFQALISTGLVVPSQLFGLKTTYGKEAKFYDQIAWFMGHMALTYNNRAGVIDFVDAVFPELTASSRIGSFSALGRIHLRP